MHALALARRVWRLAQRPVDVAGLAQLAVVTCEVAAADAHHGAGAVCAGAERLAGRSGGGAAARVGLAEAVGLANELAVVTAHEVVAVRAGLAVGALVAFVAAALTHEQHAVVATAREAGDVSGRGRQAELALRGVEERVRLHAERVVGLRL
jgi:hypothetical protein